MPVENNTASTYNGTVTTTTGQLLTSASCSNVTLWASGTSSIDSYITPTYTINNNFKYPKDGEVRIDPETGDFTIFLSEYNEWIDCDVEFKKIKDENGNKKNVLSISFEFSVVRMKNKQKERMVLTEKIKKVEMLDFTSGLITGAWTTTTIENPLIMNDYIYPFYNYVTGTDPVYLANTTITGATYINVTGANNLINTS